MALIQFNRNPSRRELRLFAALWFPLFVIAIGTLVFKLTESWRVAGTIWGAGGVLIVGMLALPALSRAVFLGLSYATFPIGFVVSYLIIGAIYFGVLTPLGLLLRALGRDAMGRGLDPSAKTYWHERRPERPAGDYFKQF